MSADLKPYPKYKNSGLPWLGKIPVHWEVRRNGRLFGARRETGFPDLPILEVSIRTGVRVRDLEDGARKQQIDDRAKYQWAVRGDIAYNMMRMWQGAVGVAPTDGLVSPAYIVARPFSDVDPAYYAYLFRTAAYMREIEVFSRGIVPDRNRLYWESFKQIPSAYPPLDEQRLIVRFLDWHGSQAAKLIRAKRKAISLLCEQKQVIIQGAITRGSQANARTKPSGVEWLGDIPHSWSLKRLKFLVRIRSGQIDPRSPEHSRKILIAPNHIRSGVGELAGMETATEQGADSGKYRVLKGEVIYSKIRPNLRKAVIAPLDCLCSADMYPMAVNEEEIMPGYLLQLVLSAPFTYYAVDCSMRVAMPKINRDALGNAWLWYPTVDEQLRILTWIDKATASLSSAIDRECQIIRLLLEHRNRLIADVVTGRLDVRTTARRLPICAAEPTDVDDDGTEEQSPELAEEDA